VLFCAITHPIQFISTYMIKVNSETFFIINNDSLIVNIKPIRISYHKYMPFLELPYIMESIIGFSRYT
jgi:hypothetical protein